MDPTEAQIATMSADYLGYARMADIADNLNKLNSSGPKLYVDLVSGSEDPNVDGPRYCDIHCKSMAKLKHFIDEVEALKRTLTKLERNVRYSSVDSYKGKLRHSGSKLDPTTVPWHAPTQPERILGRAFNLFRATPPVTEDEE